MLGKPTEMLRFIEGFGSLGLAAIVRSRFFVLF